MTAPRLPQHSPDGWRPQVLEVVRGTDVPLEATAVVYLPDERAGSQNIEALLGLHEQTVDRDMSAFVVMSHATAQLGIEQDLAKRAYVCLRQRACEAAPGRRPCGYIHRLA